jgi:hypothetical protein
MSVDRHKALLFGSAVALRLLLFTVFPSLPDVLTGRVELSTPVTSFKRREMAISHLSINISDLPNIAMQYKRDYFSTTATSPLSMAASTIKRRSSFHSFLFYRMPKDILSRQIYYI